MYGLNKGMELGPMILTGESRSARKRTCRSATSSTINSTCTDLGLNAGLLLEKTATYRLRHDTAFYYGNRKWDKTYFRFGDCDFLRCDMFQRHSRHQASQHFHHSPFVMWHTLTFFITFSRDSSFLEILLGRKCTREIQQEDVRERRRYEKTQLLKVEIQTDKM
jgi:hypothetical protein